MSQLRHPARFVNNREQFFPDGRDRTPHRRVELSFAKTGAALLLVAIANVSGVGRPLIAMARGSERSTGRAFVARHLHCDAHGAADEVTSGGASFVTMVQAADFPECDHVALNDALHAPFSSNPWFEESRQVSHSESHRRAGVFIPLRRH